MVSYTHFVLKATFYIFPNNYNTQRNAINTENLFFKRNVVCVQIYNLYASINLQIFFLNNILCNTLHHFNHSHIFIEIKERFILEKYIEHVFLLGNL